MMFKIKVNQIEIRLMANNIYRAHCMIIEQATFYIIFLFLIRAIKLKNR